MLTLQKELSRPPIYNPEDYAIYLKQWIDKPCKSTLDKNEATTPLPPTIREMSLKQFSSISDLLNKLKTDLRLAYISFVQEFVADPTDGVALLLQLLGTIHSSDAYQQNKVTAAMHRKSLLDENTCLQCLRYSFRCPETMRRLTMSSLGLFSLTVCIMSSVNKSRIVTLELLTKICCYSINGHIAVSEAMSTMRLRFAEPIRFRFLIGMMNSAAPDLLIAGLRFINTFLETSPKKQTQLYIQAELEQAGFSVKNIKEGLSPKDSQNEVILKEFNHWSSLYIDVEILKNNFNKKCKEVSSLKEQILRLESQIQTFQEEKIKFLLKENAYKEESAEFDYTTFLNSNSFDSKSYAYKLNINYPKKTCENSTPAEDEGISSSDQEDECDENTSGVSNDRCVTYDGTGSSSPPPRSQDFLTIQHQQPNKLQQRRNIMSKSLESIEDRERSRGTKNAANRTDRYLDYITISEKEKSMFARSKRSMPFEMNTSKSSVSTVAEESDIIPTKILPRPPKKSRSFHFLNENIETNPFFDDESAVLSEQRSLLEECYSVPCMPDSGRGGVGNKNFNYTNGDKYFSGKLAPQSYQRSKNHHNNNSSSSSSSTENVAPTLPEAVQPKTNFIKPNMLKRSKTFHHLQNQFHILASAERFKKKTKFSNTGTLHRGDKTDMVENKVPAVASAAANKVTLEMANKNCVLQNKDNLKKELRGTATVSKSVKYPITSRLNSLINASVEPGIINSLKNINLTAPVSNEKSTNISSTSCSASLLNKRALCYVDTTQQRFPFKKQNNAGIYSDKNGQQQNHLFKGTTAKQVPLISPVPRPSQQMNGRKKCLDTAIISNVKCSSGTPTNYRHIPPAPRRIDKITDLSSGLY